MPRPAQDGETAVYRFFDLDGQLLYVGLSAEPFRRWASHTQRAWWKQAATYTVIWYSSKAEAEDAERQAIQGEGPLHNIHNTDKHIELICKAKRTPLVTTDKPFLSITDIQDRFGISRQTVHNLRRRGVFPNPVVEPGVTSLRWEASVVAAYFAANPKQPGKRTDLEKEKRRAAEQQEPPASE